MRDYFVPSGRMQDYNHPAPDRTAYRAGARWDDDYRFKVWTNRPAMLAACRMSDKGIPGARPWRPLVKP